MTAAEFVDEDRLVPADAVGALELTQSFSTTVRVFANAAQTSCCGSLFLSRINHHFEARFQMPGGY